ncbi:hypothetical protein J437_LFUL010934 [Ladona fulva]|uniref:Uncharacterized protein n=1 Tax=Ladona fulva TaxID=123851 RepID=A0A8K0KAY4_LADFU|nr:hypothetical protein J437_LFUL010934 [Ladona fulva]
MFGHEHGGVAQISRKKQQYLLTQIGNADQTPIFFDMTCNTTVEVKGANSVLVKSTGAEKQQCTLMLATTADGRKLPSENVVLMDYRWKFITAEIIEKSFKKTGISNKLDGTEDDMIWNYCNEDDHENEGDDVDDNLEEMANSEEDETSSDDDDDQ